MKVFSQNRILVSQGHFEAGQNFQLCVVVYLFLIFSVVFYIGGKKCCLRNIGSSHVKTRKVKWNKLRSVILPVFHSHGTAGTHVAAPLYSAYSSPNSKGRNKTRVKGIFIPFHLSYFFSSELRINFFHN